MALRTSTLSPAVAVLAVGLVALSCGGDVGRDRIVGPATPAQAVAAAEAGTVTASAKPAKQAVCHYDASLDTYTTLNLNAQGAAAHLAHHSNDYAGTCAGPCPCFGPNDFDAAVSHCESMVASGLFCASDPGSNGGVAEILLQCFDGFPPTPPSFTFELRVDTNAHSCSRSETGTTTVSSGPLSLEEQSACLQIITNNCSS